MRLIDADALLEILQSWRDEAERLNAPVNYKAASAILARVERMPTIEERKKGKWEHPNRCSECGFGVLLSPYMHNLDTGEYTLLYKFCPNCGSIMEENDET